MEENDKNLELTDDELRQLVSVLADFPEVTTEEKDLAVSRLQPAIKAAVERGVSPRPCPMPRPMPGQKTG